MTLEDLINESRPVLFPDGEPENLLAAHDVFYQEGLWSLNKWVECYRFGHQNVYDHCATYFNCGMTVLPMVPGSISRIYAIDRVNEETGEEDPTAKADWCKKVFYHQVDYCHIESYVRLCQRANGLTAPATADAVVGSIFGVFRRKRRWPKPTDEGLPTGLPPLPDGYHYPQTSTDAEGRSPSGVWAIYRGRIYVAPWIQSTETLVIEWSGLKSKWSGLDPIEDDIKFKEAVRLFVRWKHESHYGEPDRAQAVKDQFFGNPGQGIPGALPEIQHECREQMRVRSCSTALAGAAGARGIGVSDTSVGNFTNDVAGSYTATCPPGKVGNPVTVTVPVGTVQSTFSVADANAKAQQKAQADAQAALVCFDVVAVYFNEKVVGKADCPPAHNGTPAATGSSVSVTVEARDPRFTSTISVDAATKAAQSYADAAAHAALQCTFHNAAQTATGKCPDGTHEQSVTIAANTFHSTISQVEADINAKKEAQKQVNALLLPLCAGTNIVCNARQTGIEYVMCSNAICRPLQIPIPWVVDVNAVCLPATPETYAQVRDEVNRQARDYGVALAQAEGAAACARYLATCIHVLPYFGST